jgi:hypothetical protein
MDHHLQEVVGRNHLDLVVVGSRHHHRNRMRRVAGNPAEAAGSLDRLEEVHLAVVGFLLVSSRSLGRNRQLTWHPVLGDSPWRESVLGRSGGNSTSGDICCTGSSTLAKLSHESRVFGIELSLLVLGHIGVSSTSTISSHVSG